MKFIQKITWDIADVQNFKDLGWNVETMDDVAEYIKDWNDEELRNLLGYATDYECWIEE